MTDNEDIKKNVNNEHIGKNADADIMEEIVGDEDIHADIDAHGNDLTLEGEISDPPKIENEDIENNVSTVKPDKNKKKSSIPSYPLLTSPVAADPTIFSRLYNTLAWGGLLTLTLLFLLQTIPALQTARALWFSDELRQADIIRGVFNGDWLRLCLNGELYQESPPFYFWFLLGLHTLLGFAGLDLGTDYARLLFIGAACSGLLFLWATLLMARAVAGFDRRGCFAAGCIVLSSLFLIFFFHYSNQDLFFASFIIFSQVFLYKALVRDYAPLHMGLAFACAAVAIMTKGALGLAIPLLSSVFFCIWNGRPFRLIKPDFLLGIVFALLPAILWLGNIWASGEHFTVIQILKEQIWQKAFGDATRYGPWWYYLAVLPSIWLPWSFLLLLAPWGKLFGHGAVEKFKSARRGELQGLAFVWISFIGSFALLSVINNKQPACLIPLLGPLAIISGRAMLGLTPTRSMLLQRFSAILFFILAVIFVLLPVYYSGNAPSMLGWLADLQLPEWEVKLEGVFLLAVILLGGICLLIGTVKARRPESTLLIMALSFTLFSYPMSSMTMPSLGSVLSSKSASVEIERYAKLGYYPVSFGVYPGVFSYYYGQVLHETDDWTELDRLIALKPRIIIAMSAKRWENWTLNPNLTEIMRFWMLSSEYVLLWRNTLTDTPDVPSPDPEDDSTPEAGRLRAPEENETTELPDEEYNEATETPGGIEENGTTDIPAVPEEDETTEVPDAAENGGRDV